jgi:hypothetical protein
MFAVPLWAAGALAQSVSLSPEIGFYIPTEKLIDAAGGEVGEIEAGPAFGLRLSLALGDRIAIGVGGADVFSYTAQYTGTSAVASELKQLDVQLRLGLGLFGGGVTGSRSATR